MQCYGLGETQGIFARSNFHAEFLASNWSFKCQFCYLVLRNEILNRFHIQHNVELKA